LSPTPRAPEGGEGRRILVVTGSAHPLGGLASWLDYLLPGLAERDWQPTLGLVEGPRHHRPERYLASHPRDRVIRISCRTGTPAGRRLALERALSGERPAVAMGVNVPDLFPALARARRRGGATRGLMTIHALEPELFEDARRFGTIVDGVAATNRLACGLLESFSGIDADRIFYAPYGRDPEPPRAPEEEAGVLRVGYAGRLEQRQKRVLDLPAVAQALEALGIAAEWRVAGAGPEESALREAWTAGKPRFLGAVEAGELPERFYRRIDALVVPSSWETGPLVAWEAMAEGVPVVVSRFVGSGLEGALAHDRNALLFDVGDTAEAARQLARLVREPGLSARLAAGGRRLLEERFGRDRSIEAWSTALVSLLSLPLREPAPDPDVPPATGRLERWVGSEPAERIRRVLRRRGPDAGPGGEWPHAYGKGADPEVFLRRAAALEEAGEASTCSPR
jgi:glycosyltransferase involved in cell wall biosynthesis